MLFRDSIVKKRRIHFIGIGGIGMSGIAEILLNLGYRISGSDLRRSPVTDRLQSLGATCFEGHAAEHVRGADVVVYSSAIGQTNPEFAAAKDDGTPLIMRGEMLAELMRLKYGVAVAGSHGKTTTTSMTAAVLAEIGKDPTVVVGGRVDSMGSNARLGKSDILLVEADESDGSFLKLAPIVSVITNVDREHLDHYGSIEAVEQAFVDFANKSPFYGSTILCIDDPTLRRLRPRMTGQVRTYGESTDADFRIQNVRCEHLSSRFSIEHKGRDLGVFTVQGVGRHNVLNAAAAAVTGLELEGGLEEVRRGLGGYSGVDRRFQLRGERDGVSVVDDYGHHPTEISATLAAARTCDFRKVHVIFQPHRYSRTHLMEQEFAECFGDCDVLQVVDIYAASEEPIPGVNSVALVEKIQASGHPDASYADSVETAIARAIERTRPGDVILTLGAGSIWRAGGTILEGLASRERQASAAN